MKVLEEYKNHHYLRDWSLEDIYCPKCAKSGCVWSERGDGDYYCGPTHVCTNCRASFTIQGPNGCGDVYGKIIDQLRSGKALEPKTPLGK